MKEDCHEVAVFRTDKFNNSCNDEKCCEKPNETINPTPESIASLRLL